LAQEHLVLQSIFSVLACFCLLGSPGVVYMRQDICGGLLKDPEAGRDSARTVVAPDGGNQMGGNSPNSRKARRAGSDSDSSDDSLSFLEAKCSICFQLVDFMENWCSRLRCCALFWLFMIGLLIFGWSILFNLVYSNQGDSSYNPALVAMLYDLRNKSFRFGTVCQFKQWTGSASFPNPDFFNAIHHEGVFLEIVDAQGVQQNFLQLDYGHAGTRYGLNKRAWPKHLYGIRQYDWSDGCKYHCGALLPSDGDPARFIDLLEQYKEWTYNVFWYNCFTFAQLVFNYHNPQTPYSCNVPVLPRAQLAQKLQSTVTAEPPARSLAAPQDV